MPTSPKRSSPAQNVSGDNNIVIGGDVTGNVIVGDNNTVNQTIIQKFFNIFKSDAETVEQRNRRIMLGHVENFWVKGILEKSLHGAALLELGIREHPDALTYPWTIKREANQEILPAGKSMLEIFQQIGMGRSLLILGAPGSGKTTMLLELTRQLIERAREDVTEPIPVVFNLSSWTEKLTLADWLARELNVIYTIPKKIAPSWVTEQKMMPLLDGLDEVNQENRRNCVNAINQFRKEHGLTSLAVCSRIQEYADMKVQLAFDGAIEIQPLKSNQVDEYFDRFGDVLAGIREVLEKDIVLRELTETPLFLSIMAFAYHDTPGKDILVSKNINVQRKYLFDTYIRRVFERPRSKNTPIKKQAALHWLSWLAQKMTEHNAVPYLIENMQPTWLPVKQTWWYERIQEAGLILLFGLIGALVGAVNIELIGVMKGAIIGMITISAILLIYLAGARLIYWLISRLRNWLIAGAIAGAIVGGILGMMLTMITVLMNEPFDLSSLLLLMLVEGLSLGLIGGFMGWVLSLRGIGKLKSPPTLLTDYNIKMAEPLRWNGKKAGKDPIFIAVVFAMVFRLIAGTFFGLVMGLGIGLFHALINGLEYRPIDQTTYPGQKIVFSTRAFFLSFLIVALIGGLMILPISGLIGKFSPGLGVLFFGVLIVGLSAGLGRGGAAVLQHYILRLFCSINNHLPWRLVPFLDYCVDRIFLRRVGGGYIFVHRLLMEHFAAMYSENEKA